MAEAGRILAPAAGAGEAAGEGGRVTIAVILVVGILLEAWLIARRA